MISTIAHVEKLLLTVGTTILGVDGKMKSRKIFLKRLRLGKLSNDLQSIKVWLIPLVTTLLLKHYISSSNWVTVIVSLIGMREVSSAHEKYLGQTKDQLSNYLGSYND